MTGDRNFLKRFEDHGYWTSIQRFLGNQDGGRVAFECLNLEKQKVRISLSPEYRERIWILEVSVPGMARGFKEIEDFGATFYALSGSRAISKGLTCPELRGQIEFIESNSDLSLESFASLADVILELAERIVDEVAPHIPKEAAWVPSIAPSIWLQARQS